MLTFFFCLWGLVKLEGRVKVTIGQVKICFTIKVVGVEEGKPVSLGRLIISIPATIQHSLGVDLL